ncbi:MAG: hypothetical protein KDD35_07200, partial [Bdellovibrionales bacterium]|nr:hypothetical protein [Bdellovibrionales bacterium]
MVHLLFVCLLFSAFFSSREALAYIPDFQMILSRTAENHGHGIYRLEQEVSFQEGLDSLTAIETWFIKDSQTMRLEVRGKKGMGSRMGLTYVYDGQQRYYVDSDGVRRVSRPGDDWYEPFLHFRFQKNIRPTMLVKKMIPSEALEEKTASIDPLKNQTQQNFLRLSRVGGVVTYGIGVPTAPGQTLLSPGLWIEQDLFNVRKIQFPSQAIVSADEYSIFSRRLSLAKTITLRWNENNVQIRIISIKALNPTKEVLQLFDSKSLDYGKNP